MVRGDGFFSNKNKLHIKNTDHNIPKPRRKCEGPIYWSCEDQFQCILEQEVCNGKVDCTDKSDEKYCPDNSSNTEIIIDNRYPIRYCQNNYRYWSCEDHLRCISRYKVCDQVQDCYDGSDEKYCGRVVNRYKPHKSDRYETFQGKYFCFASFLNVLLLVCSVFFFLKFV